MDLKPYKDIEPLSIHKLQSLGEFVVKAHVHKGELIQNLCADIDLLLEQKQEFLNEDNFPVKFFSRHLIGFAGEVTNRQLAKVYGFTRDYTSILNKQQLLDKALKNPLSKLTEIDYQLEQKLTSLLEVVPKSSFLTTLRSTEYKKHQKLFKENLTTIQEQSLAYASSLKASKSNISIAGVEPHEFDADKSAAIMLFGIEKFLNSGKNQSAKDLELLAQELDKIKLSDTSTSMQAKKQALQQQLQKSVQKIREEQVFKAEYKLNKQKQQVIAKYTNLQKNLKKYLTKRNWLFARKKYQIMSKFNQEIESLVANLQTASDQTQINEYIQDASAKFDLLQKDVQASHEKNIFGAKRKPSSESRTMYRFLDAKAIAKEFLPVTSPSIEKDEEQDNASILSKICQTMKDVSKEAGKYINTKGKSKAKVELMRQYKDKIDELYEKMSFTNGQPLLTQAQAIEKLEELNMNYESRLSEVHRLNPFHFRASNAIKITQSAANKIRKIKEEAIHVSTLKQ